ncbi:MAG: F0F1 ATP synthase subunit A [Bacteroidales bacterium]|nr:F0F1 ATP synthase subunit A [Bacteroidales bacterium]
MRRIAMLWAFVALPLLGLAQLGGAADSLSIAVGPEGDAAVHGPQHKFDPASFILDHIGDSHEWHLFTVNDVHISIPLPVILYSQKTGLHVFLSHKLQHGHTHEGFRLAAEPPYAGKIVELDEFGRIDAEHPTPWDFSISKNVATIFIVFALLCWVFISVGRRYRQHPGQAPTGLQNAMEVVILFVRNDVAVPSLGERNSQRFMPFLLTLFFFILFSNLLGLVPIFPGGANLTGNIAVTMVLAIFTFLTINLNGNKHYWVDIINTPGVPWYMKVPVPIMPVVEIAGMFIKPTVLMIRLFANILAGHMIAMVFMSLIFIFGAMHYMLGYAVAPISLAFSLFMSALELLVAFIQAFVFTMLSAVYIGMATSEGH